MDELIRLEKSPDVIPQSEEAGRAYTEEGDANKPGLCRNDTCETHTAEESLLGSLETDYKVKAQSRNSFECKKEAFLPDAMVKRKPPQRRWEYPAGPG